MDSIVNSMSCCIKDPETQASYDIDKDLKKQQATLRKQVKVLLLGAGESGKSTFLKQMRIIHGSGYEMQELVMCRVPILHNIVRNIKTILQGRQTLGIPWKGEDLEEESQLLMDYSAKTELDAQIFEEEYYLLIKKLWQDETIKDVFHRRRELQLNDNAEYFFENLDRISNQKLNPNQQDLLRLRKKTTGIKEEVYEIKGVPFHMVDVGGQRLQRHKWFKCFDQSVTSVLFLVASSAYDQVIVEDKKTPRLEESCNIFDTIVNNKCFKDVSIILFLNKTDLLHKKLEHSDFKSYMPNFRGNAQDIKDVQGYLLDMFDNVRRNRDRALFHHFTTATDTENIKYVFAAVKDTILQNNLRQLMLQ